MCEAEVCRISPCRIPGPWRFKELPVQGASCCQGIKHVVCDSTERSLQRLVLVPLGLLPKPFPFADSACSILLFSMSSHKYDSTPSPPSSSLSLGVVLENFSTNSIHSIALLKFIYLFLCLPWLLENSL